MGVLRALVGGSWVDIGLGGGEVYIGPDDPSLLYPSTELWYDTDEPAVAPATVQPSSWSYGKFYVPGSNLSSGTGGGYVDWFTVDAAVPVPAWATKFTYRVTASYLQYATAGGNVYNIRLVLGSALGNTFNFGDATKSTFDLHWGEQIPTVSPGGNQVLKVQANRVAGTGTWSAGTFGTTISVTIDWFA